MQILPFHPSYQNGVILLLKSIEEEYEESFYSPDGKTMNELYLLPGRKYWVAMVKDNLIGTIGIIMHDGYATLKSMFLHKSQRGGDVAVKLLQTAIDAAVEKGMKVMYLGTMAQFIAAQRFYEKHGFIRIKEGELPKGFPANVVDTVFYKKIIG